MRWWNLKDDWHRLSKRAKRRAANNAATAASPLIDVMAERVVRLESGRTLHAPFHVNGNGMGFVRDGTSYAVRTTDWNNARLREPLYTGNPMDVYILVAINLEGFEGVVVGWLDSLMVQNAEIVDVGDGPKLTVPAKKLNLGLPPELRCEDAT